MMIYQLLELVNIVEAVSKMVRMVITMSVHTTVHQVMSQLLDMSDTTGTSTTTA